MERGWPGLPFRPISEFYKTRFGEKVYKIPVSIAETCPNREGLRGMNTCSFCDVWGSAAREEALTLPLREQIEKYREIIQAKKKAKKFLVYFQAYTTTFNRVQHLRECFAASCEYDDVVGFVIGTRPDCLSPALMDLWQEYHDKKFVSVEMGVQTFDERSLLFLQRGHTAQQSIEAIHKIAKRTTVDQGIHLIFGLPGETEAKAKETALICNDLPITHVKLHNLHVLKNTELERWFHQGLFEPMAFEQYARHVQVFLENLHPRFYVHRLAAYASRWDELVAPAWTANKMKTHQGIVDYLRAQKSTQSKAFLSS